MLRRAAWSVLRQTYSAFEYIIVDDASADDTQAVVKGFGDERVRYLRRDTCGGVARARNTGIREARGDWVFFLDDDDEYLPDMLERSLAWLSTVDDKVAFCWCGIQKVSETNGGVEEEDWFCRATRTQRRKMSFVLRLGAGCGMAFRRTVLLEHGGFDEHFEVSEDRDLMLGLVARGFAFIDVPEILTVRHYHRGPSLSRMIPARRKAAMDERLLEKHRVFLDTHPNLRARILDDVARTYLLANDRPRAIALTRASLKAAPYRPGAWKRLIRYRLGLSRR
jgi:glycosyltransferase involved in cell wall biosynthesis